MFGDFIHDFLSDFQDGVQNKDGGRWITVGFTAEVAEPN